MKKRIGFLIAVILFLVLIAVACGEKSKESVTAKLEDKIEAMSGYKAKAVMKMVTGQEEQKYDISILYKKKDFYRVELANDQDEKGSQVILKNKDGVFVLTPALKKSFKFQTDWPENSSQAYLYQSLVQDVKKDKDAVFKVTDSHYVFHTKTNYQSNNNLPFQEIHFNKKDYTPELVKVLDKDKNTLVEVKFSNFEMNPSFKEDDFEMDKSTKDESAGTSVSGEENMEALPIVFPLYTANAELVEKKEVSFEDGERVIMTFEGEKKFTLIQERLEVIPVLSSPQEVQGDIVNLGYTIGALTENSLEWNYNGVSFHLASEDLTKEELIEVAQSVQGKEIK